MDFRLCYMHGTRETKRKSPYPLRKELTRLEVLPDDVALYEVRSGTYRGLYYHPCINLSSGEMDCHCKDFDIRHAPAAASRGRTVNLDTPQWWCKHLKLVVIDVLVRGEGMVSLYHGDD